MLKKLVIKKFKSCENVEISDIGEFLVLVGKNGVGKTNIFRALHWVSRSVSSGMVSLEESANLETRSVEIEVLIDGKHLVYQIEVGANLVTENNTPRLDFFVEESLYAKLTNGSRDRIFERRNQELTVGIEGSRLPIGENSIASLSIISLLPTHTVMPVVTGFVRFVSKFSHNHLDTLANERTSRFLAAEDFLKWQKTSELNAARPSDTEMHLLDLKTRNSGLYEELIVMLCHIGIIDSFDIVSVGVDTQGKPRFYVFNWMPKYQASGESRGWNELSFGTRRLIKLFVAFFYQDDSVFMLEQPEDGIHAGLLHEILPMLRTYVAERQIFMATHSPEVMNAARPEEIRIVHSASGVTSVRELSEDELDAACSYLQDDGPLYNFISMIEG
ncbi:MULTISPECIES: AAA family ATPase [unclassified Acidovorax]|uniref:AAA family ATPase n=1 Tax=unclassified Acidovorax TaxID=2684926 RepID=UPI0028833C15|nr:MULTISPECIES: AAA family ATPase [unclassified Acidovorax]